MVWEANLMLPEVNEYVSDFKLHLFTYTIRDSIN